tara:strand:- start:179 stop:760 length:582 start_codon:yes stop_codon:yes gene_type:complete
MSKYVVYETYKKDTPHKNYVGKSTEDRVLKKGYKGSGVLILRAMRKNGWGSYATEILARYDKEEECYEGEKKFIAEMNPHYNLSEGGRGSNAGTMDGEKNPFYGKKHSKETKEKMRKAKVGSTHERLSITIEEVKNAILETGSVCGAENKLGLGVGTARKRLIKTKLECVYKGNRKIGRGLQVIGFKKKEGTS